MKIFQTHISARMILPLVMLTLTACAPTILPTPERPKETIDIDQPLTTETEQTATADGPLRLDRRGLQAESTDTVKKSSPRQADPDIGSKKQALEQIQRSLDLLDTKIAELEALSQNLHQDLQMMITDTLNGAPPIKKTLAKNPARKKRASAPSGRSLSSHNKATANSSIQRSPRQTVTRLRVGDHIDYVRIVADFERGAAVNHRVIRQDNDGVVTITLPDTKWLHSPMNREFPFLPFLEGYDVSRNSAGETEFKLFLSPNAKAEKIFALDRDGQKPRLVIDLRHR